jgi:hypothetical protein
MSPLATNCRVFNMQRDSSDFESGSLDDICIIEQRQQEPRSIFKTYWKQTESSATKLACPESPRGVAELFSCHPPEPLQLSLDNCNDHETAEKTLPLVECHRDVSLARLGAFKGWWRISLRAVDPKQPLPSCLRQPRYSKRFQRNNLQAASSSPLVSVTFKPEAEVVYLEPPLALFAHFSWFD